MNLVSKKTVILNTELLVQNECKKKKINFIDLFAGTGAFSLVLKKYNKLNCVFTNDMIECSKKNI